MTTILVVDDEAVFAMQLSESLAALGYEMVGTTPDGAQAISMAKRLKPDLVLMDMVLPGKVDGIAAAKKIRTELNIPVIFISGQSGEDLVGKAKLTEPYGFIPKPIDAGKLIPTITIALYKHEMETKLKEANNSLEDKVRERTTELSEANKVLNKREKELDLSAKKLEELNTALRVMIKKREQDRAEMEERVMFNIKALVLPFVERLKKTPLSVTQETYVSVIENNLNDLVAPFSPKLPTKYLNLTPTEIQVANLVREGKNSRAIADLMGLSKRTIEYHRDRIRKKTGIKNKKANLRTHEITLG